MAVFHVDYFIYSLRLSMTKALIIIVLILDVTFCLEIPTLLKNLSVPGTVLLCVYVAMIEREIT